MAGGTRLIDGDEQRIGIAIDGDSLHILEMARFFAFVPELLAAAAVEPGPPRFQCLFQRFFVHIGHHQDFAAPAFLYDGRHEAFFIKFDILYIYIFHYFSAPLMGIPSP